MSLLLGDIVIVADLPDLQGVNPKPRPAVVVTPSAELEAGGPIFVVAITTRPTDISSADRIELPWSRPRHPRTGLNKRNAVICRWLVLIHRDRIARRIGVVPPAKLLQIIERLNELEAES